ncbi:MAG TPA: hypothetical protein ENK02_04655 [Planctomycetes bacterium]|nr:hypothetical protein [Planctomycetota bacterium]
MSEEKCQQILAEVDAWVMARPERRGVGYHNSQRAGQYDPALAQVRSVLEDFFGLLLRRGLGARVLQVGLGRHGGMHYALSLLGGRLVTVEREERRVRAYLEDQGLDPARETILVGDPGEAATRERVRELLPEVDVLLLDGEESYGAFLRDWRGYAPLVRVGGLVAFCDGSQAFAGRREELGVGRFLFELERDYLLPREARLGVFHADRAILYYEQSEEMREEWARGVVALELGRGEVGEGSPAEPRPGGAGNGWRREPWPVESGKGGPRESQPSESQPGESRPGEARPPESRPGESRLVGSSSVSGSPRLLEELEGFSIHAAEGGLFAVPGGDFDPREIDRDAYPLVLWGEGRESLGALVRDFVRAEEALGRCRGLLAEGRLDEAQSLGAELVRGLPGLRERLLPSYHLYHHSARLGLVLGTFMLFADRPREGWFLLRKVLRRNYHEQELIQVLARVAMEVLRDEVLGRELLEEVRAALRRSEVGRICREELRGSMLWSYPEFLAGIGGVLQVGVGSGTQVGAFDRLGLPQVLIEPDPRAREKIQGGHPILACAVGAAPAEGRLLRGLRGWSSSLAELAAPFRGREGLAQVEAIPVPVRSLDGLVAEDVLPAEGLDLLWIDAGGRELEVLKGAEEFLKGVDLIRCKVFFAPLFEGTPEPEELRLYLDERGFWLRAYEPGPQGLWGEALFRRTRRPMPERRRRAV